MQGELSKYLHRNPRKNKPLPSRARAPNPEITSDHPSEKSGELLSRDIIQNFSRIFTANHHSPSSRQLQQYPPDSKNHGPNPNMSHNITFLPPIDSVNSRSEQKPRKRKKSWLERVLSQKQSFAKHYFKQISVTRQNIKNKAVDQTLPDVKTGKWLVKGYIFEEFVFLRAESGEAEVSKKYPYHKVSQDIQEDYRAWVMSKFNKD